MMGAVSLRGVAVLSLRGVAVLSLRATKWRGNDGEVARNDGEVACNNSLRKLLA